MFVFFFMAGINKITLATNFPIPFGQDISTNFYLPFELPGKLYEDSFPKFPKAFAVKEFPYLPEGKIIVYFYQSIILASEDMKLFGVKNEKIKAQESKILIEHGGCLQEDEQNFVEWFSVGKYVIGIQVPKKRADRTKLVKLGEEICVGYNQRINQLFSTPEMCFETYLKAVEENNKDLILECMCDDGSEKTRTSLNLLEMMLHFSQMAKMNRVIDVEKKDIKFGKPEIVSENEVRLPLVTEEILGRPALELLTFGGGYFISEEETTLFIPFKKIDGKWGIDLVTIQDIGFAKSRAEAVNAGSQAACISNLKQIGLALRMYSCDYKEKFPDDLNVLYPMYISTGRIFKCPGDKTISEIKEVKPRTKLSYTYVAGLTEEDGSDKIIAYDASFENHEGKGRNVLFLDGHVAWKSEKDFQKLLKKNTD